MPVVPGNPAASYNPVPDTTAQPGLDTRPIRLQTDPEMFGAGIGRALSQTGSTLEKVGDEWASTALQFARLDQETKAAAAATQYYQETGKLDAAFRSMSGTDPQNNLINHNQRLDDLRQQFRAGLTPFAAKLYDQQTLRSMGYDMRNSALHAASESKRAALSASQDNQAALIDQAARDPNRTIDIINGVKEQAAQQSRLEDGAIAADADPNSPEVKATINIRESKVKSAVGTAMDKIAMARARTDPDGALKMLDQYRDQMHEPVYQQIREKILDRSVTVNAETEAARITSPYEVSAGPGRANFMRGQYGAPGQNITTVDTKAGKVSVNATAAPAFEGFINDMVAAGAPIKDIGGFNDRNIAGTGMKSQHAFGNAIDIDQGGRDISPKLKAWADQNPEVFRSILRKYNMISGGDFRNPDFGHFEWGGPGQNVQTKVTQQTLLDFMREAEVSAQTKYPDDPVRRAEYTQKLSQAIMTRANVQQKVFNDQLATYRNSIFDTLNQKPQGSDRSPTSVQEAQAVDPQFMDKYEYLTANSPADKGRIDHKFAANAKEDIPDTLERQQQYTQFYGLSPEEQAAYDPYGEFNQQHITRVQADKIYMDQQKLKHNAEENNKADLVLNRFQALRNDLKAYPSRTDQDANTRYQWLRGAVILRMREYAREKKAPMSPKDVDEMMKDLSKEVTTKAPTTFLGLFNIPGTGASKRQYELDNPIIIENQGQYNNLASGQAYIYNGVPARKK